MKKIAFFDIDGTLTSEIDGSIPQSAITAIRKARANGNLMFLNTGRCIQNVEPRFQEVGFDGFVCGCGTDIYCGGKNLLHVTQSHEITMELLKAARDTNVDIVFESSTAVAYDTVRPVIHPDAVAQYDAFVKRGYTMPTDLESPDFICDKFVIWFKIHNPHPMWSVSFLEVTNFSIALARMSSFEYNLFSTGFRVDIIPFPVSAHIISA